MNQFAVISSFETLIEPIAWGLLPNSQMFTKQLRHLAAQFQMHYALVHRLSSAHTILSDATYVSILRDLNISAWTLGDLIGPPALSTLLAHNRAVLWLRDGSGEGLKHDPLNRLNIRFGISIPYHNALGNHAALTLCDSYHPSIDMIEFTRVALPLVDAILTSERCKNTAHTALSTRETDCLQWVAAGKTSIETGIILGLSPHTVNQYLTSATTKLEAVNRTHAVTKAVRLGLINLSAV